MEQQQKKKKEKKNNNNNDNNTNRRGGDDDNNDDINFINKFLKEEEYIDIILPTACHFPSSPPVLN